MVLSDGDKLGPYEIIAPIGVGGMGEVYRARDPRLNRDVAIKVAPSQLSERFEREARAIAALNHPNICQIYDIGPNYIVMEFIQGAPLHGPLPLDRALRYAAQICDALDAAHKKSITHRDLKPGNILVTASGVKLLDFGLAKIGTASASLDPDATARTLGITEPGTVLGTAAYMSPEQAKGDDTDARSDIFSFGLVLYEMLSGRRAFSKSSIIETMAAIVRDEPAQLDAPPSLSAIVSRCLRKIPASRFQTAKEVLEAIEQAAIKPTEELPSIAVLPFANMSADKENEYFSDGLAEEILNLLAKIPGLKVIARTSSFAFRGKEQDITKIAEALRVQYVLEGSVRKAGIRIRVTAQLIHAADGTHLWSERYDRELADVFAIQDEISQSIANALELKLSGKPAHHKPPVPAYEALLKGRHHRQKYTAEALTRARLCFEQAIALDPVYAAPHAELGTNYLMVCTSNVGGRRMRDLAPLVRREARKALELDPLDATPHYLLGALAAVNDYDWGVALREFRLAKAGPTVSAETHWAYGAMYLGALGRFEESTAELRQAVAQDPLNVSWRGILVAHLACGRRLDEALEEGLKALEIEQNPYIPYLTLGEVYFAQGQFAEAATMEERALETNPGNAYAAGVLAASLIRLGNKSRARDLIQNLGESPAPVWGVVTYHLLCSELELAANWYEKMIEDREPFAVIYANSPYTEELRSSPYWPKLANLMNLPTVVS